MGIIESIVLSIIEGVTEFIPVSSTAHILLAAKFLAIPQNSFVEVFSIAVQSGAILAAIIYFWKTIWKHTSLFPKIFVAFIPTAIAGILLYPVIKSLLSNPHVLAYALIVGGIGLILIKPNDTEISVEQISYKQAFGIGISQIASFIPGISRAGATLIGGTLMDIPRSIIIPFSFLLAIPTIGGASVVALRDLPTITQSELFLLPLGMVISFITALLCITFFINVLSKKPLSYFGWYRIVLGIIVLMLL